MTTNRASPIQKEKRDEGPTGSPLVEAPSEGERAEIVERLTPDEELGEYFEEDFDASELVSREQEEIDLEEVSEE